MCVTEVTIDLMQDLPQLSDNIYSLLMHDDSLDTEATPLIEHSVTELSVSGHTIPVQSGQIEDAAIAA